MENLIEKTIVAFHIGRGGRFNNQGHLSFVGVHDISYFTDDLFINYENQAKIFNAIKGRENLENKYYNCCENDDFSFFEKLGFDLGKKVFYDQCGNEVGLTEKEYDSGVGSINIDHGYDTTYTCCLEDCDEDELRLILAYSGWIDSKILDYCRKNILDYED